MATASTARPSEYLRFQRMLLDRGTLDGTQILQEHTVEDAFSNQIGDLDFPAAIKTAEPPTTADFNAGPGYKFGLGLLLNTQQQPSMRRAGSGAWAGIFNTHFWVDPTQRHHRRDLHADAAVRRARGLPGLHRLRDRAVRSL